MHVPQDPTRSLGHARTQALPGPGRPCSSAPRGAMLRPHPGQCLAAHEQLCQVLVRLRGSRKTGRARDPPGPPSEAGRGHGGCSSSVQEDPAHLGPESTHAGSCIQRTSRVCSGRPVGGVSSHLRGPTTSGDTEPLSLSLSSWLLGWGDQPPPRPTLGLQLRPASHFEP